MALIIPRHLTLQKRQCQMLYTHSSILPLAYTQQTTQHSPMLSRQLALRKKCQSKRLYMFMCFKTVQLSTNTIISILITVKGSETFSPLNTVCSVAHLLKSNNVLKLIHFNSLLAFIFSTKFCSSLSSCCFMSAQLWIERQWDILLLSFFTI